jgi:acyl-CoA synthetase (AMP-forming)/AMP-acid ligase II
MEALASSSLLEVLRTRSESSGATPAFIDVRSGRQLTYQDLHATALGLAARLRAHGVERNSVVGLVANDTIVFPLLAACCALEAQLAIIDASLHPLEIAANLEHAEPKLVIASSELVDRLSGPGRTVLDVGSFGGPPGANPPAEERSAKQGRLIIYTSGSTGAPKGVVLPERAVAAQGRSLASAYALSASDRLLCVLPFYHMNAVMVTGWGPIWAGATTVVAPLFSAATAKSYWATMEEYGITICSLTPSIMSALLKLEGGEASRRVPRTLRFAFCGAAPLRADLWKRFEDFIGVPVHQGYGLTETTCWAAMTLPEHARREGLHETVGVPVDCEIRISSTSRSTDDLVFDERPAEADPDAVDAPPEREPIPLGEVEIRGPLLMEGYYRNKALTRETFTSDGFLRTGDLGCFDAGGLLHIIGRRKEIIIKNGINIVPDEIDAVLRRFPDVAEAKSIGLPDDVLGELICSVCVVRDGAPTPRAADLRKFVREHLAPFKCPDRVVFAGHIPRTPTGKPRAGELRRIVNGELAVELLSRLDTWKFKRAQPSERDRIVQRIGAGLLTGRGVTFVAYWGCGNRDAVADPDREALERLKEFVSLADRHPYALAKLVLIFTDVHAAINGKGPTRAATYFAQIADHARRLGFETVWLSELWKRAGLDQQAFLAGQLRPPESKLAGFQEVRDELIGRAEKHSELHSPEEAARMYYEACQLDATAVESAFKEGVFLTYNGPAARFTLPGLPTMYIYSYKRKRTEKPWFM